MLGSQCYALGRVAILRGVETGGRAVSEELGISLQRISMYDLGSAKKVTKDKDSTTIIEGAGTTEAIEGR
jgi:chaperonin GroEL